MAEAGENKIEAADLGQPESRREQIRKIIRPLGGSAVFHLKEAISTRTHFLPPEFETEALPEG